MNANWMGALKLPGSQNLSLFLYFLSVYTVNKIPFNLAVLQRSPTPSVWNVCAIYATVFSKIKLLVVLWLSINSLVDIAIIFFRSYLSDRILEFVDEVDFFKMLHFVILVVLLNRLVITAWQYFRSWERSWLWQSLKCHPQVAYSCGPSKF